MKEIRYIYRYLRNSIIRILAIILGRKINMPQSALIISPHPDDETLGCGGLIAHLKSKGCKVNIIMMTGGENCEDALQIDKELLKKIRRNLTQKACEALGVKQQDIHFLDFIDGNINDKSLEIDKLKIIINTTKVEAIFIPHLEDGWNDHVQSHYIIKKMAKNTSANLYAYCVWFWYTMPFYKIITLSWRDLNYLKMSKNEKHCKRKAVSLYMDAKSPEGFLYSGNLPNILIKSCLWKHELYFKIKN